MEAVNDCQWELAGIKWPGIGGLLLVRKSSSPLHRLCLLVQVMILVWCGEVGLVADVHDRCNASAVGSQVLFGSAWLEDVVKPRLEGCRSSTEIDESLHVVRYGE